MGTYLYGSKGFSHRSTCFDRGQDLTTLEALTGAGTAEAAFILKTQAIVSMDLFESLPDAEFFEGTSWFSCACGFPIPEFNMSFDIESAIDTAANDWTEVVDLVMSKPNAPLHVDIGGADTYTFTREDWPRLAQTIGHGADPTNLNSVKQARDTRYEEENLSIHVLLANALLHAMTHDLDTMTLSDPRQGMSTNLWDVIEDYVSFTRSKEEETYELRKQLFYFEFITKQNSDLLNEALSLLTERYDDTLAASVALRFLYQEKYKDVLSLSSSILTDIPLESSITLRQLTGDAHLCLDQVDEARTIAKELEAIGSMGLAQAIKEYEEQHTDH